MAVGSECQSMSNRVKSAFMSTEIAAYNWFKTYRRGVDIPAHTDLAHNGIQQLQKGCRLPFH